MDASVNRGRANKTVLVEGGRRHGAKTIVKAIQARKPRTRYGTGGGASVLLFLRRLLTDAAFDAMIRMFVRQETSS